MELQTLSSQQPADTAININTPNSASTRDDSQDTSSCMGRCIDSSAKALLYATPSLTILLLALPIIPAGLVLATASGSLAYLPYKFAAHQNPYVRKSIALMGIVNAILLASATGSYTFEPIRQCIYDDSKIVKIALGINAILAVTGTCCYCASNCNCNITNSSS